MSRIAGCVLTLVVALVCATAGSAFAQSPVDGVWSGWLQCKIEIRGSGYSSDQVHTWELAGTTPKQVSGAFRIHAASWSASGEGVHVPPFASVARKFTLSVAPMPRDVSLFVRASDNRMIVKIEGNQPVVATDGGESTMVTASGAPAGPGPETFDVYEWVWPWIEGASPPAARMRGKKNFPVNQQLEELERGVNAQGTANCEWDFAQGNAAARPPSAGGAASAAGAQDCAQISASITQLFDALKTEAANRYDALIGAAASNASLAGALGAQKQATLAALDAQKQRDLAAASNACAATQTLAQPPPTGSVTRASPGGGATITAPPPARTVDTSTTAPPPAAAPTAPQTAPPAAAPTASRPERSVTARPPLQAPPPSGGDAAPPAAASGVYLVSINGLLVGRPTNDTRVAGITGVAGVGDPDGRGDEAYAAAYVRRYQRATFELLETSIAQTLPYGDITNYSTGRLKGGTQTPTGGLQAGDKVPDNFAAARAFPAGDSAFPLKAWQGRLTDGADVLLVAPSIWEYDGANPVFAQWLQSQAVLNGTILQDSQVQGRIAGQAFAPVEAGSTSPTTGPFTIIEAMLAGGSDSPIGTVATGQGGFTMPNTTLVLTREIIEKALGSTFTNVQLSNAGGVVQIPKPGILVLNFARTGSGGGPSALYSMVVQVEKVSD